MANKAKILLGLGNAVDYELVWNSAAIEALIQQYEIQAADICSQSAQQSCIDSERTLVLSILSYLETGRGGECTVNDSRIPSLKSGFAHNTTNNSTPLRISPRANITTSFCNQG